MLSAVFGTLVGLVVASLTVWEMAVLSGWITATGLLLVWVWAGIFGMDGLTTARVAAEEDESRYAFRILLLSASTVSLVAVVAALHHAISTTGITKLVVTGAALQAIANSWLTVQTVFTLRYAALYYADPCGGVAFPGTDEPSYRDFAYLAFTIGMTFQVSDTEINQRPLRSAVLRHALISYIFGAAIIAASINVVASFVGQP